MLLITIAGGVAASLGTVLMVGLAVAVTDFACLPGREFPAPG
jgi:hypothetical protein